MCSGRWWHWPHATTRTRRTEKGDHVLERLRAQFPLRATRVAVVWAPAEARTEMFAKRLDAEVLHVHYLRYKKPLYAPLKYVAQVAVTLTRLFRIRPSFVYVTNPPVFAALVVLLYGAISGAQFVMDTHSPALFSRKWSWTVPLQRWVARRAVLNVVDQPRFRAKFESWGARACVLERPPESFEGEPRSDHGSTRVTVINTFASDEPLGPVIEAAAELADVELRILGDVSRAPVAIRRAAPPNVRFVGYLRGQQFHDELLSADVIVALTTFRHSLLAAAQDALAAKRPLVTSDQPVLRDYFGASAVYVAHDGHSLAAGIREALVASPVLVGAMSQLQVAKRREWEREFATLRELVDNDKAGHPS
jgi:Glycosyl transferases group 1